MPRLPTQRKARRAAFPHGLGREKGQTEKRHLTRCPHRRQDVIEMLYTRALGAPCQTALCGYGAVVYGMAFPLRLSLPASAEPHEALGTLPTAWHGVHHHTSPWLITSRAC